MKANALKRVVSAAVSIAFLQSHTGNIVQRPYPCPSQSLTPRTPWRSDADKIARAKAKRERRSR